MTYKTILVHLDERARRAERLDLAFELAVRFDAHLTALLALSATHIPSFAVAEAGALLADIEQRRREAAAASALQEFRRAERLRDGKAQWLVSRQEASEAVREAARCADLVVLGQPEPGDPAARGFAEELLLSAGRPLLFVPYAGRFPGTGLRVLVAWDGGREAARAVADALPLLGRAQIVEVVSFDSDGEMPSADVALYLARHGVKATAARQSARGVAVGEQLLSRAGDLAADLIVMGGYGHSRLRELALGGATRTVLESMTVPVLMSH